jgi:peptidyl-prolyl cis-trans isomerase A (cyclophilin A)
LLRNSHAQIDSGGCCSCSRSFCSSPAALAAKGDPHVLLTTSAGNIELELNSQKAPVSVKNFVDYVNSGFYNNTTFHRVIPGFMVQGGGLTSRCSRKA